ncbi:MAG: sulfotransferase family protein [Anaerolineaceae bacterium]|nr:MAG: sulfotransferase family protein [Anaerolineaceae bacterium]
MTNQPLLVTGAHRTGTTWVGKMLAAGGFAYVSEPLNVSHRPGVMAAPVRQWYQYITRENEENYLPAFQKTLALRYGLSAELKSLRSRRDILRMGRDLSIFLRGRVARQPALLKDPFAVFSLPWFAERLNCRVIVTIRHPAGFASSLKKLNWPFDFKDLLDQPLLMRDHLEPFRADMERIPHDDIIGQSALLWRMVYRVVHADKTRVPSMFIVRHEDLSLNPVAGFAQAYASLGMAYTAKVQETIRNSSSSENPVELSSRKTHSVKLDSRANLENWKKRLAPDEIARVRDLTEDVASLFYADVKWD